MLTSAASAVPKVSIRTGDLPEGNTILVFGIPARSGHDHKVTLRANESVEKNLPGVPSIAYVLDPHGETDVCLKENGMPADTLDFSAPHLLLNITYHPHHPPHGGVFCELGKGG